MELDSYRSNWNKFNLPDLSRFTGINLETLSSIINDSQSFYRNFSIKKRSGTLRNIEAPFPVLKMLQRWILDNILNDVFVHASATGFLKKKSILNNAQFHVGQKCLLKADIENYFPSINIKRVIPIFMHLGFLKKMSYILSAICTKSNILPQGAPTSPHLANIVSYRLDVRLKKLSEKLNLRYSRYADDIALSGNFIHPNVIRYIHTILMDEGFKINNNKTHIAIGNKKKIITGISVNSNSPKLPRNKKREIRAEVCNFLNKRDNQILVELLFKDPVYTERLLGKLKFWSFIEKDSNFPTNKIREIEIRIGIIESNLTNGST